MANGQRPTLRIPAGRAVAPMPVLPPPTPAPYAADQPQPDSGGFEKLLAALYSAEAPVPREIRGQSLRLQSQRAGWRGPAMVTGGGSRGRRTR